MANILCKLHKEKERKLVVFSDSREDAAQVANGIERKNCRSFTRA